MSHMALVKCRDNRRSREIVGSCARLVSYEASARTPGGTWPTAGHHCQVEPGLLDSLES
ncbi:hypothetical protein RB2000 [Rhodopirellula baltica SH 1]|uniref:Uncharacterized protein n=1 Tax=Rhodopirellula baltica (strain DSM 10527 / NCIMB 13988 / SH1) TaxID=243090 RepID=Q7UWJ5_RHOBA|nr:hypothetical protein RB2000 [Rhodopirellula baltica SH 1]